MEDSALTVLQELRMKRHLPCLEQVFVWFGGCLERVSPELAQKFVFTLGVIEL